MQYSGKLHTQRHNWPRFQTNTKRHSYSRTSRAAISVLRKTRSSARISCPSDAITPHSHKRFAIFRPTRSRYGNLGGHKSPFVPAAKIYALIKEKGRHRPMLSFLHPHLKFFISKDIFCNPIKSKTGEWSVCLIRLDERLCLNQLMTSYVDIMSSGYLGRTLNAAQGQPQSYEFYRKWTRNLF